LLVVLATAASCGPTGHTPPPAPRLHTTSAALDATPPAPPRVEIRVPKRARWIAASLASEKPTIAIRIYNPRDRALDVSALRAHLEVEREGVPFRCSESAGPDPRSREPATLAPKASFVFERTVDCALPLTGSYRVWVAVSFGGEAFRSPRAMKEFTIAVSSAEQVSPRRVDRDAALWAAVGASGLLSGETGLGSGRIAVSLVNGGPSRTVVPAFRLGLRVYRGLAPIPCEDEPVPLRAPAFLDPGEAHREPVTVSCLGLHAPGKYEVAARLLRDGADDVEIGRLQVEISSDPSRRAPPP
jgi:hypothetical protein